MNKLLRCISRYQVMHRRISNQRKELAALNQAVKAWQGVAIVEIKAHADTKRQLAESQAEVKRLKAAFDHRGELLDKADTELAEMTADRNLWQDAHNDDCPNKAMVDTLTQELEMDALAEAGLCYFKLESAREFLKDIRRVAADHNLSGGLINPPVQEAQDNVAI